MQEAKLLPSPDGIGGEDGRFGFSVSVDGNRALVGGIGLAGSGAALVLVDSGSGWVKEAVLLPADGEEGDNFGASVSLSGDRALVGASRDDDKGLDSGAAYVFDFDGTTWNEAAKLVPADGAADDLFGAGVSLSGDRALVSAGNDDNDNGDQSGSAYVFDFDGTIWNEAVKLTPADGAARDRFGFSVSLSGDRVLIGAGFDDDSGSAYVFDFDGTAWSESAKLTPADGAASDFFGASVSLSGDRALVSADRDDDNGKDSGSAYVFDFDGTVWSETVKLTPADGTAFDSFASSVSLSGDRALVGASGDDAAWAYVFDFDGASWGESAKLIPGETSNFSRFGASASLSGDRALVGAFRDSDDGTASGSAHVFDLDGASWRESAKLTPADGAVDDEFGYSVSLSGDRALVGAIGDDDNGLDSGAAYVFDFDGTTWRESARLVPADGFSLDNFGFSVSLSGDRALVGAYLDDDNGSSSGSAYVFDFDDTTWRESAKLVPADGAASDEFGYSVSLSGDRALIGAYFDDDNGSDSGSAYVFVFDDATTTWSESAKLTATDGAAGDWFGRTVSLSGDRALIGAESDNDISGAAYVFDFDGTDWGESAKLTPDDGVADDVFGRSVSLLGDRALVSAIGLGDPAAYVFDFDGAQWRESAKLVAADDPSFNFFGTSVSLAPDWALIGASADRDNGRDSGAAYVFDFDGTDWSDGVKLVPADAATFDSFGTSVALSGGRALVGAIGDDDRGSDSGSAYVTAFERPPIAMDDDIAALEDRLVSGNVFADNGNGADTDPNGDTFDVQSPGALVAGGIGGTVNLSANGDFTYTPPADQSGVATFGYTIADPSGSTDSATVTITVEAVNDAPSFTPGGNVQTLEDTAFSQPWAADISTGPQEPGQIPSFNVSNDDNALFAVQPTIDASGVLSFTPAPDTTGSATVTVTVTDDGGTENGGVDESAPSTFNVSIDAGADVQIDKSVQVTSLQTGAILTYTVTVTNPGPSDVDGVVVEDIPPTILNDATWTCSAQASAVCGNNSGTGAINVTVDIPEGDNVVFQMEGTIDEITSEAISNTATATVPSRIIEIDAANNVDTATIAIGIFSDRFE